MKCYYHEDRESANNCAICGKPICSECGMEIGGNILCKDCVNTLINDNLSQKVSGTSEASPQEIKEPEITQSTPEPVIEAQNIRRESATYQESPSTYTEEYTPRSEQNIQNNYTPRNEQNIENSYTPRNEQIQNNYTPRSEQQNIEDKYERYLDDLYFDEPEKQELSLKEQLALDKDLEEIAPIPDYYEEEIHSRRRDEWVPQQEKSASLSRRRNFHKVPIRSRRNNEPYSNVDILLTALLIILILLVIFYIIYLFVLSSSYPTFIDAIVGLFTDPGKLFGSLFGSPK
ncbi:LIM domain-containing protein [Methanobrevibacter sp.]